MRGYFSRAGRRLRPRCDRVCPNLAKHYSMHSPPLAPACEGRTLTPPVPPLPRARPALQRSGHGRGAPAPGTRRPQHHMPAPVARPSHVPAAVRPISPERKPAQASAPRNTSSASGPGGPRPAAATGQSSGASPAGSTTSPGHHADKGPRLRSKGPAGGPPSLGQFLTDFGQT